MTKHTNFSTRLDDLQQRVATASSAVQTAATESEAQLKERIDRAQADLDQAVQHARQEVSQAAEGATRGKWAQLKADAAAKRSEVTADLDQRALHTDAKIAGNDADWAEADGRRVQNPRLRRLGGRERAAGDPRRHPRSCLRRQAPGRRHQVVPHRAEGS